LFAVKKRPTIKNALESHLRYQLGPLVGVTVFVGIS